MPVFVLNAKNGKKKDRHAILSIFLTAAFLILLDQLTKVIILNYLSLNESVPVVEGILYLTLVCNRGAAFGLFQNQIFLFIVTAIIVVMLVGFDIKKNGPGSRLYNLAMGLLLAGALGNLLDRLFKGCVVDFIDFRVWPVFNVADSAITIGAVLLGLYIFNSERKGRKNAS